MHCHPVLLNTCFVEYLLLFQHVISACYFIVTWNAILSIVIYNNVVIVNMPLSHCQCILSHCQCSILWSPRRPCGVFDWCQCFLYYCSCSCMLCFSGIGDHLQHLEYCCDICCDLGTCWHAYQCTGNLCVMGVSWLCCVMVHCDVIVLCHGCVM